MTERMSLWIKGLGGTDANKSQRLSSRPEIVGLLCVHGLHRFQKRKESKLEAGLMGAGAREGQGFMVTQPWGEAGDGSARAGSQPETCPAPPPLPSPSTAWKAAPEQFCFVHTNKVGRGRPGHLLTWSSVVDEGCRAGNALKVCQGMGDLEVATKRTTQVPGDCLHSVALCYPHWA